MLTGSLFVSRKGKVMNLVEKRKHKRLVVNLDLLCRELGSKSDKTHSGHAVNASPGGLYFETDSNQGR